MNRKSKYDKKGIRAERELHGTQNQSDCAYLGIRSVTTGMMGFDVGVALIRHIMNRHFDTQFGNVDQRLIQENEDINVNGRLTFNRIYFFNRTQFNDGKDDEFENIATYGANLTDTVRSFGNWFRDNIAKNPKAALLNPGSSVKSQQLYGYRIETEGGGDLSNEYYRNSQIHRVDSLYVKAYSRAVMTVQNVTTSDAGSLDKDVIDTNPVKGYMYHCSKPLPEIRETRGEWDTATPFSEVAMDQNNDGVLFPAGDPVGQYKVPPPPQNWKNCTKASKIQLAPGAMKKFSVSFKYDGTVSNLVEGLARGIDSAGISPHVKTLGTCTFVAMDNIRCLRITAYKCIVIRIQILRHFGLPCRSVFVIIPNDLPVIWFLLKLVD